MNSNASFIDDERAAFLANHQVNVSISLDGYNPKFNDVVRIYKSSVDSTFKTIIRGCNNFRKYGIKIDSFYLTLVNDNIGFSVEELAEFAKNNELESLTAEPDLLGGDLPINTVIEKLIEIEKVCTEYKLDLHGRV